MKNVAYAALVLFLSVGLYGCVGASVGPDGVGLSVAPLASLPRVQEGEKALTEAVQETQEAVADLAEKVEGGEEVIADLKASGDKLEQKAGELKAQDFADSEWFYLLLAALGIPLVKPTVRAGRRTVGALAKLTTPVPPADTKATPPAA